MHGAVVLSLAPEDAMVQSVPRGGAEPWAKLEKGGNLINLEILSLRVVHFSLKAFSF